MELLCGELGIEMYGLRLSAVCNIGLHENKL